MTQLKALFLEQAADDRERLAKALADGDLGVVRSISHSLSGRAGLFGFPDVSREAAAVEEALDAEPAALRRLCKVLLESLEFITR